MTFKLAAKRDLFCLAFATIPLAVMIFWARVPYVSAVGIYFMVVASHGMAARLRDIYFPVPPQR